MFAFMYVCAGGDKTRTLSAGDGERTMEDRFKGFGGAQTRFVLTRATEPLLASSRTCRQASRGMVISIL
ncbi:hypothetical protein BDV98DRAFT_176305 [Pterulicium gracile]|uniref:Uncharacterized protein n=1 Tax=Pterulicium gracile TaxID=1884261 RepID=A0A5C3QLN3_9AGAR|nr:hypothetical protein BDV98DRAFT_176305 [Pterula gracilis]